jgi:hypothetical protein
MVEIALICVREDNDAAEKLSAALGCFGFSVCRSASVFEDFRGYAAVVVLLSPGAARSELVIETASRAHDWGKLIPAFVNLCRLPDQFAMLAMHDLSNWNGDGDDRVVEAIAYHAHRLAGLSGRPVMTWAAPPPAAQPRPALDDGGMRNRRAVGFMPNPAPPRLPPQVDTWTQFAPPIGGQDYGFDSRGAHAPPASATTLAAIDDGGQWGHVGHGALNQRQQREVEATYILHASIDDGRYEPAAASSAQRRRRSFLFGTVMAAFISAGAMMGLAVFEEGRSTAQATVLATNYDDADLSDPSVAEPQPETPRAQLNP